MTAEKIAESLEDGDIVEMKCALCGKEIKGRDYIRVNASAQKEIYVHPMSCESYESEGDGDNGA